MRPRSPGGRTPGRELLVGLHPVREALRARRRVLHRLILRQGGKPPRADLLELSILAEASGVPVERQEARPFDRALPEGVPHQGVALEAGPLPRPDLLDLVPPEGEGCWLLALDGVEDPQNLGAVLRVADAAGVRGILLPEHRAAPLTPAVARASAGAVEHLPVAPVVNLPRALHLLKDHGFWVHGADPDAEEDLFELPERAFDRRMVLVVGAEGRGIRPAVRAALDRVCRIPMGGAVASLNVSAAAAVVLFEWRRRLRAAASLAAILPGGGSRL